MTTGILVVHTPAQAERASTLCDMLEAALSLEEGAIVCSSLPGYTLGSTGVSVDEWNAAVASAGAVVVLVDDEALGRPQFLFELASAVCFGKWLVLLLEHERLRDELPWQVSQAAALLRGDRTGLSSMVEDIAFQLDVSPRLGGDAQSAMEQLVAGAEAPPPAQSGERERAAQHRPRLADRPPAPSPLPEPLFQPAPVAGAVPDDEEELIPLDDEDFRELGPDGLSCELSLEAGRAISECSFHRDNGGNWPAELDEPFGRFVDAVGGNWDELRRIQDIDVWLGATDNLLESLPPDARHVSDWFELGFQFSTLMSIAEQGLPPDPEQRAAIEEVWSQSMSQFQRSAENAQLRRDDVHRMQALLQSLISPDGRLDYSTIPRSLEALRNYAALADG